MMPRAALPPLRTLPHCPQWPTSHTLPRAVVSRLDRATWQLRGTGRPARRQDVLGLTIMFFAPTKAAELVTLMTTPHPALGGTVAALPSGRYSGVLTESNEQLMAWLPSPVTLRLNALVAQVHDQGFRASRRQLVSALALHALPRASAPIVVAFDRYLDAPARAAQVPGRRLREVLTLEPPKPGRRPMT
jgi:hypothetical protein